MYNFNYIQSSLRSQMKLMYLCRSIIDKRLEVHHYDNAVVRPFMGITIKDKFIDESYLHVNHDVPKSFKFNDYDSVYRDEEVIYIGMFINIWGHCLTDCMKHLWIFLNEEERFKKLPLVWVPSRPGVKMWENFWTMLDLLGVDRNRIVEVKENTKFKKVYLPDHCFFADENNYHRLCTKEYGQLFDKIMSGVETDLRYEKVYFTRSKLTVHNRDYGERSVEKVFEKKGYKVLSPETLPLKETIAILKGCKSFATTDGSIGHNSLFLQKGTECILIRKADTVNSYQAPISQIKELNVTIIDAHWSKLLYNKRAPWDGPFFIYCNRNLRKWAGEKSIFPVWDFVRYCHDVMMSKVKT